MKNRFPLGILSTPATLRRAAPLVALLAAITAGLLYGVQLVVLTLAASALLLVIWLLWSSVQALAGQSELTFEEAFSLGTRSAEEEQKRAVLRALKDLEYERSVGKISEDDYHEYSARYRAEAKRLIQTLDENLADGRKQVEQELTRRLAKKAVKALQKSAPEARARADSASEDGQQSASKDDQQRESEDDGQPSAPEHTPSSPEVSTPSRECAACQVKNELDARFYKACNKSMAQAEESQP